MKRTNKPIKVAINCYGLKPGCGGVASYFRDIVSAFLDGSISWEPRLFHSEKNIHELDRLLPPVWRKYSILGRSQEMYAPEHRHSVYFAPLGPYYPNPVPVPTVITLADNQEVFFPRFFTDNQLMERRRSLNRSALFCDSVMTMSNYSAECLIRGYGIKREKMHICYAYSKKAVPPQKPAANIPERFVFYPANRWGHKNHRVLIEAIAELRRTKKADISLVCTGATMKGGFDMKEAASRQGITDLVHDLGFVDDGEVSYLYMKAEALVFPSLYEGFGYPVLEAMKLGCPVITSTAGSLPEVAGKAAAYFDPNSSIDLAKKLMCVWGNERMKSELTEKGHRQAAIFSKEKFLKAHRNAFVAAIENYSRLKFFVRRNISRRIHDATMRIMEAMRGPRYSKPLPLPVI